MTTPKCLLLTLLSFAILGCSGGPSQPAEATATAQPTPQKTAASADAAPIDPMQDKGIGPVTNITLEPIDKELAATGEKLFKLKCTACHKMDKRRVGPPLRGVTARRTPEWIMNFIINPAEMLEKNRLARELLAEYSTQMADQSITEPEARSILEYLRTKE